MAQSKTKKKQSAPATSLIPAPQKKKPGDLPSATLSEGDAKKYAVKVRVETRQMNWELRKWQRKLQNSVTRQMYLTDLTEEAQRKEAYDPLRAVTYVANCLPRRFHKEMALKLALGCHPQTLKEVVTHFRQTALNHQRQVRRYASEQLNKTEQEAGQQMCVGKVLKARTEDKGGAADATTQVKVEEIDLCESSEDEPRTQKRGRKIVHVKREKSADRNSKCYAPVDPPECAEAGFKHQPHWIKGRGSTTYKGVLFEQRSDTLRFRVKVRMWFG